MTPSALYKAFGAFDRPADDAPELAHIPAELRHLAVPIDRVRLDPANVNKHPPEQLEVLKSMLREFGQRQVLVVRESTGVLEAGEGRILAGRAIGWQWIAVLPCDDDPITALRFALGDNQVPKLAEVDDELLAIQLLVLRDEGADLASIGWTEDDVAAILEEPEAVPEDLEEPDAPLADATFIKPGDLIVIGEHRLVCGDSTDPAVVAHVMLPGELADMVFEDPPYGVGYHGKESERTPLANDNLGFGGTRELVRAAARAWPLRSAGAFYVCSSPGIWETAFRDALAAESMKVRQGLVWVKHHFVVNFNPGSYHYQHETILYGSHEDRAPEWHGPNNEPTVWEAKKPACSKFHPTEKPLPIPARAIRNSSTRGAVVFDGFGGSGTTLLAAHQLGRRARLIELEPAYCDVIVRRAVALGLSAMVHRPGEPEPIAWQDVLAGKERS